MLLILLTVLVASFAFFGKSRHVELPNWVGFLFKFNAITLPPFGMFYIPNRYTDRTVRHEMIHWEQYKRLGFFGFYLNYLILSYKHGYWNNPMEIEAREKS